MRGEGVSETAQGCHLLFVQARVLDQVEGRPAPVLDESVGQLAELFRLGPIIIAGEDS